jgi:hypothetical protein
VQKAPETGRKGRKGRILKRWEREDKKWLERKFRKAHVAIFKINFTEFAQRNLR